MTLFKTILYRGVPYLGFGYGAMYTNRNTGINKVWYINRYPILLKTRIFSKNKKPFRSFVINDIISNPELSITKDCFNYRGELGDCGNRKLFPYSMFSVYARNSYGVFYIGNIRDAYSMKDMSMFRNQNLLKKEGVANIAYHNSQDKWCGWSHRAIACFGIGDRIFDSKYGTGETPFNKHGDVPITSELDMIESASRFANYVS